MPSLITCDLSGNRLSDADALVRFLEGSPHLTELDLTGNAPSLEASAPRVVAAVAELRVLNRRPVTLSDHVRAVGASRARNVGEQARRLRSRLFDAALESRAPGLLRGASWDPCAVTELDLDGQQLTGVFVGGFTGLRSLTVSRNLLEDIASWGAHKCPRLGVVRAAHNRIGSAEALDGLRLLAALRVLSLEGNGACSAPEYRARVITATRWGSGTAAAAGLQVLDGVSITPAERVAAPRALRQKPETAAEVQWQVLLQGRCGRDVAYAAACGEPALRAAAAERIALLGVLVAPGSGGGGSCVDAPLTFADVTVLTALQILWLPGHDLREVAGLRALRALRSVDLRFNSRLMVKSVLAELATISTLETVALLPAPIGDREGRAAHARAVAAALLPANRGLYLIEYAPVPVDALVEGFKALADPRARSLYRWHLALVDESPRMDHSYHPGDLEREVLPRVLRLESITELRFPERGIEQIDVRPLAALRVLILRRNAMTTVAGCGLEARAGSLRVLDLRENMLNLKDAGALKGTCEVIARLTALEYLGIGGNGDARERRQWAALAPDARGAAQHAPVINNARALAGVVRMIPALKGEGCRLRYINDGSVSADVLMLAFGGTGAQAEVFRVGLLVRALLVGSPRGALEELDLSEQRLKHIGGALAGLVRLRVLSLARNQLSGRALLDAGLGGLVALTALDVSRNAVSGVKDLARTLSMPPRLSSAVVVGNKCFEVDMPLNRVALLSKMPTVHHRDFALKVLNGAPIVTEERIAAVAGRVSAGACAGARSAVRVIYCVRAARWGEDTVAWGLPRGLAH